MGPGKPKREVKVVDYFWDVKLFYKRLTSCVSWEKTSSLLRSILTPSEVRMLKRRWHVACLLTEGHGIRETADIATVGKQTVLRVAEMLERSPDFQKAVGRSVKEKDRKANPEISLREELSRKAYQSTKPKKDRRKYPKKEVV